MTETLQTILTALGNAIIGSFWQTGLLWLLVVLYSKTHRELSPARLNRISFAALLSGFLAFVTSFIVSLYHPQSFLTIFHRTGSSGFLQSMLISVALGYAVLLLVQIARLAGGLYRVSQLKTRYLSRVPGELKIFLLDACQYLDIKRKVKIFSSALVSSPLTIGFFKPVILLPVALLNQLSIREAEAVILHELAHIKRKDYLQNLVTQIILVILYFNPFARMLAQMQSLEREKSADNWVIQFQYNKQQYAGTLLRLARQSVIRNSRLAIPLTHKHFPLMERVEWILGTQIRRQPSLKNILLATTTVLVTLFASVTLLQKPVPTGIAAMNIEADTGWMAYERIPVFTSPVMPATTEIPVKTERKTSSKTEMPPPEEATVPVIPPEDEWAPHFVSNLTVVIPSLNEDQEQNIKEALESARKIMVETGWERIERSLAETVKPADKENLKRIFSDRVSAVDLEKQANTLRLYYNQLNWPQLMDELSLAVSQIELDSVYHRYRSDIAELNRHQKQLAADSAKTKELQTLNHRIGEYKTVLLKLDSLRSKRIVEL